MPDILLTTDDGDGRQTWATGGSVTVSINQNIIHPERWWILTGIELVEPPHGALNEQMLAVVVGMMHALTVTPVQIDLHRRVTSLAPGAHGVALAWPCAVHVPPRQNLWFTHSLPLASLTPAERETWDALRIRAEWMYGRDPTLKAARPDPTP